MQVHANIVPAPNARLEIQRIESASLPLASRRLGRSDETWLQQVLVRLRVIETHLSLFSARNVQQVDHLQMNIKQARAEIDALYLAMEQPALGPLREALVCCEAKGRRDDILLDQVLSQVRTAFAMAGVTQDIVIPFAVKAFAPSKVHVVEFEAVERQNISLLTSDSLRVASEAVYEFVPPMPGIGG